LSRITERLEVLFKANDFAPPFSILPSVAAALVILYKVGMRTVECTHAAVRHDCGDLQVAACGVEESGGAPLLWVALRAVQRSDNTATEH
jgi:hypothetical protein